MAGEVRGLPRPAVHGAAEDLADRGGRHGQPERADGPEHGQQDGDRGQQTDQGARTVVVSLTPTAAYASLELMLRYHDARAAGCAARDALRAAQLALADDGIYPPAQWGGFMVFGGA